MCICLNCDRINKCRLYFIIEEQHQEKIKGLKKSFSPQGPILVCLNFFFKKRLYIIEWDVNECLSYQEKPGSWLDRNQKKLKFSSYLLFDLLF
uniref:Ycf34 n=1 Tax=Pleurocladia lacustris TaxID=246121 RepID=A0A1I9LVZ6_9PHAE|nr:hypothetical protein [Pleurocladia lacustris]ANS57622.1 hypothetical protein [Pleurocladia lacustris]ANS57766.1 hypothetical protein [Pleurocladia lacustris]